MTDHSTLLSMNSEFYFFAQVNFSDGICRSAYGIMVEALPHATEENIEKCIKNMQDVTKLGIEKIVNSLDETILVPSAEFDRFPSENEMATSREERPGLHRLLDLCTADSGKSMRWERPVRFNCTCSDEKIWSVLQLLGRDELSATTALHPEKVPVRACLLLLLDPQTLSCSIISDEL